MGPLFDHPSPSTHTCTHARMHTYEAHICTHNTHKHTCAWTHYTHACARVHISLPHKARPRFTRTRAPDLSQVQGLSQCHLQMPHLLPRMSTAGIAGARGPEAGRPGRGWISNLDKRCCWPRLEQWFPEQKGRAESGRVWEADLAGPSE